MVAYEKTVKLSAKGQITLPKAVRLMRMSSCDIFLQTIRTSHDAPPISWAR